MQTAARFLYDACHFALWITDEDSRATGRKDAVEFAWDYAMFEQWEE